MKKVVSISLGTPQRDKKSTATILGQEFEISRVGVDGDLKRYRQMFIDLDGKVDALGVGGADIYVVVDQDRYVLRQIADLVSGAKVTPVVDGSGLKHTLERETIRTLAREGTVDFRNHPTLLVSAADRFGMAQALVEQGGPVAFGDLNFGLGINLPIRKYAHVKTLGRILLPIISRLPFKWIYPTGEKQLQRTPKYPKLWAESDIIAGDWHYIRRYAPDDLTGKTVITNTLRQADIDLLRSWHVARAITTTPLIGGETFATNVMEGVVVTLLGKRPDQLTEADYLEVLARLAWKPQVIDLGS
jgi:hypothetical protein